MPRLPQPDEHPEDDAPPEHEPLGPEPLLRHPEAKRIETVCDTIVLVLLVSVLVLGPLAFGGADQDLAPFSKTPFAPVLYYFNYAIAAAAVLMALAWVIKMVLTERVVLARTPVDIPILAFLAYGVVRAATCASPTVAFREIGWLAAYVTVFYVAVNVLRTRRQQHIVLGAVVVTALGLTLMALVMSLKPGLRDLVLTLQRPTQYSGRLSASYVCPNHYAGLLEMAIPLVLALVMVSKARLVTKLVAGAAGIVLIVGLILSMSRGGWISLALGIIFMLAMATWQKRINLLAWVVPLVVIVGVVGGVIAQDKAVRNRFKAVFDSEDASYAGRAWVWTHTLDLARKHLLFGTGPGTYRWACTLEQPGRLTLDVRHAHNDYLQTWSDYGLIGLALLFWGLGSFGFRGVRALRRARKSSDFALVLGVLGSTAAMAAHSFVDFNMRIPANLVTMLVLAGVLVAARQYQLRRLAEVGVFKRSDTRVLPVSTKVLAVTAAVVAAAAILTINARKHEARIAWHRGRVLDVTLPKPIGLKERALDELAKVKADAASDIRPEVIDKIREAIEQFESPTAWEVRTQVDHVGSRNGLSEVQVFRVTYAVLRAQGITRFEDELVRNYRKAVRCDESNFEFHAALSNFYFWKGQTLVRKNDVGLALGIQETLAGRKPTYTPEQLRECRRDARDAFTEAIGYGDRAFILNPLSGDAAFGIAESCRQMRHLLSKPGAMLELASSAPVKPPEYYEEEARNWYGKALELHPHNPVYRNGYGEFLQSVGEYEAALNQFQRGHDDLAYQPWIQPFFKERIEKLQRQIKYRQEQAEQPTASPANGPGEEPGPPVEGVE